MASVAKRPNGQWRARYRDEAGKEHSRHFAKKSDAQRWLDQVTASIVRGDYVDPRAGQITLADFAGRWQAVQVSSSGTARIVDNALRLHILPELGEHRLSAVRRSTVQGLVKRLEDKGLSPGTVRGIYFVLSQVFGAAVDDKLLASTPCIKITLPRTMDEPVSPPTVDQVAAFRDALPSRYRAAAVVLAGAGPRIGEVLGLDVEHVNFARKHLSIQRQRRQDGTLGPLKTKKARRDVPLGDVVIAELTAHLAARRRSEKTDEVSGPLFVDEFNKPLLYRRWRQVAETAARRAGVDITAHDLRHFYASALIAGGASVKQVQVRLGHFSPVVTLETYAHLWPGDDDRTRDVMDAALKPLADTARTDESQD